MTIQLINKEDRNIVFILEKCAFLNDWHLLPSNGRPNNEYVSSPSVVGVNMEDGRIKSLSLDFYDAQRISTIKNKLQRFFKKLV